MPKIRLTKNELKTQRDDVKRFRRYLPTLQLKKQQIQLEVRRIREMLADEHNKEAQVRSEMDKWLAVVDERLLPLLREQVRVAEWQTGIRNIAGLDIPTFLQLRFVPAAYDLFLTPPWVDDAVAAARRLTELELRRRILEAQIVALEQELRITTQRVNLFEKVKIPESTENIRKIQIYLGDQMTSGVGRAKIAKGKGQQVAAGITERVGAEVAAP